MIIASFLYFPLKQIHHSHRIFLFVVYPLILSVRGLEFRRTNDPQEEHNRKKYLILLALTYIVYSLFEVFISTFQNRCFVLFFLAVGGIVAKEKGFLDQGIEKVKEIVAKNKVA